MRPLLWFICGATVLPIIMFRAAGDGLRYMTSDQPNGPKIVLWKRKEPVGKNWKCPVFGSGPCTETHW